MDSNQLNQLRTKMEQELVAVAADVQSLEDLTRPIAPDVAIGRLSRMDAINNKSINEAALRSLKARYTQLTNAFNRLNDPEFGICEECLEPIPVARLMLMPESTHCVTCAE